MSREYPTLKGSVVQVRKGKTITFGFVRDPSPMNGYQGEIPSFVFVKEGMLGGTQMREGMLIAFDARRPEFERHKNKFEAHNIQELHSNAPK